MQILFGFEEFDKEPVKPPVDIPIHRAQVVSRGVVAVIRELHAGPGLPGAPFGMLLAAENLAREQMKLLELDEKRGIKKGGRRIHGLRQLSRKQIRMSR